MSVYHNNSFIKEENTNWITVQYLHRKIKFNFNKESKKKLFMKILNIGRG